MPSGLFRDASHDSEIAATRFAQALGDARQGCGRSLGEVLDACRRYLLSIARAGCPHDLAAKVAPSDLVQQSMLDAHRHFGRFHGDRHEQLRAWMNQILRNNMIAAIRKYRHAARRQVSRECRVDGPSASLSQEIVDLRAPSPLSWAIAHEEAALLEQAINRLPSDYRQAILLHSWYRMSFDEVGVLMERSADASRKLWRRGMLQMQQEFKSLS